jgi:hypothetical protein
MKDWRGTSIKVGSKLIYASHMGPSSWVTEAVVDQVLQDELVVLPIRSTREGMALNRPVHLKAVSRVTVLPSGAD